MSLGIGAEERRQLAAELTKVLADSYMLYFKTHAFHWNVTGPRFHALHVQFGEQYAEIWKALDVIAERIRALGYPAPSSQRELAGLASISAAEGTPPAEEMIRTLQADNAALARSARRAFTLAERANDQATADLLADRMRIHEKYAWMLRASLD